MSPPKPMNLRRATLIFTRGVMMGGADVVPGVSGGTMALLLGIYQRLVTAISHIDRRLLRLALRREFRGAAEHLDLGFLMVLGGGIFGGFLLMTLTIDHLLNSETLRPPTLAAFFGMVLASAFLVARLVKPRDAKQTAGLVVAGVAAAAFSFWLTLLPNSTQDPSLPYVFFCGCVAICAMILPGVSGAMILFVLGVYMHLAEIPKQILRGEHVGEGVLTILVFGAGCAISLIIFSKFVRWLLESHFNTTMAVMCGMMFGALGKLWPFQLDKTPDREFKYKDLDLILPPDFGLTTWLAVASAIVAVIAVIGVERLARAKRDSAGEPPTGGESIAAS